MIVIINWHTVNYCIYTIVSKIIPIIEIKHNCNNYSILREEETSRNKNLVSFQQGAKENYYSNSNGSYVIVSLILKRFSVTSPPSYHLKHLYFAKFVYSPYLRTFIKWNNFILLKPRVSGVSGWANPSPTALIRKAR